MRCVSIILLQERGPFLCVYWESDKVWENEYERERENVEYWKRQNKSNEKSTRTSSKTLCLTVLMQTQQQQHQQKLFVWCVFSGRVKNTPQVDQMQQNTCYKHYTQSILWLICFHSLSMHKLPILREMNLIESWPLQTI